MPNFQAFWNNFAPKTGVVKMGVLNAEQKRNFFAAIDLFALPSRTDSFGLVLLEAWANRKPNLVYRAGGPGELVRAQIDGLQARCGDIQELTAQLARLIAAPELRRDLGERGFARIHSEFQWPDKLELVRNALASAALSASLERACGVAPPRITVPAE
jgi:glycosyltransferase involved in cell wall biosynthesis